MQIAVSLIAPLALLISPALLAGQDLSARLGAPDALPAREQGPYSSIPREFRDPDVAQVRIEQQVTIRIAPRPLPMPMAPQSLASQDFESGGGPRWTERKFGKCMPLSGIVGVQPGPDNRLILLLRDRRVVSASLDKSCRSRDYYSGFLVAKNADGQLCQKRDQLLARSGASCQVSGFRQLVQVDD